MALGAEWVLTMRRTLKENWQPIVRAAKAETLPQLRHCLEQALYRAGDAAAMPWPALADSWQREADAIRRLIELRGAKHIVDKL
jgi:hypothetical protein